jgi:Holliday junction resolvase RusA-like endonuclease
METLFKVFIPGRPIIKKNTQKVVRLKNGRRVKIDSPRYKTWKHQASAYIKQALLKHNINAPLSTDLQLTAIFHFKNRQAEPDLSNLYEGIQDLLQEMGVIKDDKLIQSHDGSRKVFGESEGIFCELKAL